MATEPLKVCTSTKVSPLQCEWAHSSGYQPVWSLSAAVAIYWSKTSPGASIQRSVPYIWVKEEGNSVASVMWCAVWWGEYGACLTVVLLGGKLPRLWARDWGPCVEHMGDAERRRDFGKCCCGTGTENLGDADCRSFQIMRLMWAFLSLNCQGLFFFHNIFNPDSGNLVLLNC